MCFGDDVRGSFCFVVVFACGGGVFGMEFLESGYTSGLLV